MRPTHPRRRARLPDDAWNVNQMPERTPLVADAIRYIDVATETEVSPMSALGYLLAGRSIDYETFETTPTPSRSSS